MSVMDDMAPRLPETRTFTEAELRIRAAQYMAVTHGLVTDLDAADRDAWLAKYGLLLHFARDLWEGAP